MTDINALVLTGYGLNCDHETAYALRLAGANAKRVHINSLFQGEVMLSDFQIMVFIGGFSWGDDHGAGVVQAIRMKTNMGDQIRKFIEEGKLVLGICNGFQTLVNMGLLPGFDGDYQARNIAVTYNDCGNFRDEWVNLGIETDSRCVFTRGMESIELPVRHGEGKFMTDETTLARLKEKNQVVCRYIQSDGSPANGRFPDNPNGSMGDVAGICDETGRVFGLMPHPEAYNHFTNHPDWTRIKEICRRQKQDIAATGEGIRMFENAVEYLKG